MARVSTIDEKTEGERLLAGLENGGMSATAARSIAERLDPALGYLILSFLRAVYPVSDPAASGVLERVVRLTSGRAELLRRYEEGKADPISRWFEECHSYRDFKGRGRDLVELIVDKIES